MTLRLTREGSLYRHKQSVFHLRFTSGNVLEPFRFKPLKYLILDITKLRRCEKIDRRVNIYINGKFEVGGLTEINWNCGIVWILSQEEGTGDCLK